MGKQDIGWRGETERERENVGAEGKKHRLPDTYFGFLILYLDPLQYSCLENPLDRGAWQATVHGVTRVRHHLATKPRDPTSLVPHERLTDLAVVPREKPHTGAAAREQPRDSPVIER